jgi:glycosyl-4,4'-diaponeurosporenoate acyltransferase
MLFELSNTWIVVLNVVAIPAIHFGLSWFFTRLPRSIFATESFLFRKRAWERGGAFYQNVFLIRRWKHLLPDAAPWFDGFAKGNLQDKDPAYLRAFIAETCRGEACHYAQAPALCLTLIWNPWPAAAIVMIVYAVLSNLPCLLLQRFTRARLHHLLAGLQAAAGT